MVIAERILTLRTEGTEVGVPVRLHAPEPGELDAWVCRFEIGWPEEAMAGSVVGHDAVQALHLALQMIGVRLYLSDHHVEGRLSCRGQGPGYGFPVTQNLRDLLVGDDAAYF